MASVKGNNQFSWDRHYLRRIERMKKIDLRLMAIRLEAKALMQERIELVREGFPNGRNTNNS